MQVKLVRRWGAHEAGSTVDVDDTQGKWLVGNSFGEHPDAPGTAFAGARAPGEHGADPRAGGDVSRGGGMQVVRGGRTDGKVNEATGEANYANRAAPVSGSPRPGGPNDPKAGGEPESDKESGRASGQSPQEASHTSGQSPVGPTPEQKQSAAGDKR